MLALTLAARLWRYVLLVPTLYLAAFVWENVMLASPARRATSCSALLLIVLMIVRPQGLLGERRVEIV